MIPKEIEQAVRELQEASYAYGHDEGSTQGAKERHWEAAEHQARAALLAAIERRIPQWRPASEPPDSMHDVLVWYIHWDETSFYPGVCWCDPGDRKWRGMDLRDGSTVINWSPLPPLPEPSK